MRVTVNYGYRLLSWTEKVMRFMDWMLNKSIESMQEQKDRNDNSIEFLREQNKDIQAKLRKASNMKTKVSKL
jgi:hypothetical protein